MKENSTRIKKVNKNRQTWKFVLGVTENLLYRIGAENPILCDVYNPKGHCFLKGLDIKHSKKYRHKEGYKIKIVDNKKLTIELKKIIRFLKKELVEG
jgi:hypothetical protein